MSAQLGCGKLGAGLLIEGEQPGRGHPQLGCVNGLRVLQHRHQDACQLRQARGGVGYDGQASRRAKTLAAAQTGAQLPEAWWGDTRQYGQLA